jgi:membrane protease YdiL (CAAX protease family)
MTDGPVSPRKTLTGWGLLQFAALAQFVVLMLGVGAVLAMKRKEFRYGSFFAGLLVMLVGVSAAGVLYRLNPPALQNLRDPILWGAVLASLVFALCHLIRVPAADFVLPSVYALLIFFPALWFAWLRARTQSIIPGILAHALANAVELAALTAWGYR